jgi:hypothetical protein
MLLEPDLSAIAGASAELANRASRRRSGAVLPLAGFVTIERAAGEAMLLEPDLLRHR